MKCFKYLGFLCVTAIALLVFAEGMTRILIGWFAEDGLFMLTATAEQFNKSAMTRSRLIPHPYLGFVLRPNCRKGLTSYNSRGYRGEEFAVPKPENEFRIVCVGGSTTYDDEIEDDAKTYPARLQAFLEQKGYSVKVINAGVPAWTSYENLINFALRVSSIGPDLVIDNDGRLDLHLRIVRPETYAGDNTACKSGTIPSAPWYEQLTLVRMVQLLKLPGEECIGRSPAWRIMNRPTKNNLSFPTDPYFKHSTLTELLKKNPPYFFRRNLVNLVAMARAQGAQTLLLTYPYWRRPESFPGMWNSSPESSERFSQWILAMDEMNGVIKSVGQQTNAPVFDLENAFPQPDEQHVYYKDGVHNIEAGANLKASLIADYIVKTGLIPEGYRTGKSQDSPQTQ